jgi:capsular polysaccharide export protein
VNVSSSKKLINNTKFFIKIKYINLSKQLLNKSYIFYGWGRKKSGQKAISLAKKYKTSYLLLEDGFIRSLNLGINNSPSFSIVEDDIGIYYDATVQSKLENILNTYDFKEDKELISLSKKSISLLLKHHISKYNQSNDIKDTYFPHDEKRVLVIAQTFGDSSLEYGLANTFSTAQMITSAIEENTNSQVYIKIHPDVLSGKKKSDIDINTIDKRCKIITDDINPISLLKNFHTVYTKTSQMGFEAILVGCKCVCFGMPFYAGWGITDDRVTCERRKRKLTVEEVFAASYILYTRYYNPYTKKKSDIIDTIKTIVRFRELERKNDKKVFLFGFSRWKHGFVNSFLKEYEYKNIIYINPIFKSHYDLALKKGLDKNSDIFIWGRKDFEEIENFAKTNDIKITRIEDGFIRSVGLGSDLTRPYSLVIDKEGIYFDPTNQSTLETILKTYDFQSNQALLEEAEELRKKILKTKISKYNTTNHKVLDLPKDKTKILVSGQVEDDASIRYGAKGMTNLQLLKEVKDDNPNAYIVYKPHPDELSGNRVGNIEEKDALAYCNLVLVDISMSSVLDAIDEVHTMTSLTGFEGLLYGKKVVTYGLPFYAGWRLTLDKKTCDRRNRTLSLNELITAVYILYPRYIDPQTLNYCTPSVLIDELEKEKKKIENFLIYKIKIKIFTYLSRTSQKVLSLVK